MQSKAFYEELISICFGEETRMAGIRPVSGGDINEASLIVLSDGRRVFLKENTRSNIGFFEAEQKGLAAIKRTNSVRIPQVIGVVRFAPPVGTSARG